MSDDADGADRSRRFRFAGALNRVDLSRAVGGVRVVRAAYATLLGLVLAYLFGPLLVLLPASVSAGDLHTVLTGGVTLSWYANLLARPWLESLAVTVAYSLLSTVVAVALGGSVAFAVERFDLDLRRSLTATTLWPLALPQVVLGFGLFLVLGQYGLVGNTFGLAMAVSVFATPFASRSVASRLRSLDRRFEEVAYTLGADEVQTFAHVTLPALAPGLFAAAAFAFVVSVTNLQLALFLHGPGAVPLAVRLFDGAQTAATPVAAAVATVDVVVAVVAAAAVERTVGVGESLLR
ncbi:MAG: ABC transporter permease [Haloferacaceae archaeon]